MNGHLTNLCRGWLLAGLAAVCGCNLGGDRVTTGETRKESKAVALGAAQSVRVSMSMKAGELKVEGGATDLLDADFTYNVPEWKPEVRYDVSGGVGNLEVEQSGSGASGGNTRNEWDVHLSSKAPMEMTVNMGAGRATLTLSGLALSRLELNMGAGETTVDLTGNWKKDLSAQIHGGVGRATIRLPRDVGVHVVAQGGLGSINASDFHKQGDAYVNDQYGKSPVTLQVEVEGGVGEINLELAGEPPAA
ncbi:MAG TPA: toast rack family protein [Terriglobia bacterium]|nr:toast rack family protein [Terriglobia bacterium]